MIANIKVIGRDEWHYVRVEEDGEVREMRFINERFARDYARTLKKRYPDHVPDNVVPLHISRDDGAPEAQRNFS